MDLTDSVSILPGIGVRFQQKLGKLGIVTLADLLDRYPVKYRDRRQIQLVNQLQDPGTVTLQGSLLCTTTFKSRSGKSIQTGFFTDSTGKLPVTWFNQPFLKTSLNNPQLVNLSGKVALYHNHLTLIAPEYEPIRPNQPVIHSQRLVPQYAQTAGLTSRWLRQKIFTLINSGITFVDWLPPTIITSHQLLSLTQSYRYIHFPPNRALQEAATRSLSFRELLILQLIAQRQKHLKFSQNTAPAFQVNQSKLAAFIHSLPFELTAAQLAVIDCVSTDLQQPTPMQRLVQGDVGSGKTAVAAVAAHLAHQNHLKTVLLAPTALLAQQHATTLKTYCASSKMSLSLQTRTHKDNMAADILIGTHALLHRRLPPDIGLIIIDEQHRFGVNQRQSLTAGNQHTPHLLSLTATPIPRTLARTLYANLDVSRIDQLPPGRKKVITRVVKPQDRKAAYQWIATKLASGEQAFVVCPLIVDSLNQKLDQVKSAESEYAYLNEQVFPQFRLGLIHGKIPSQLKQQILDQFRAHQLDLLVATPVIEVGVDIPQASIMLIENAERFGLASLHQLRGRVGRGHTQSYCLLAAGNVSHYDRIKHLETIHDGLKLAQLDLKLRGFGQLFGTKQSGFIHTKIADLTDSQLITETYQVATKLFQDLKLSPTSMLSSKLEAVLEKYSLEA